MGINTKKTAKVRPPAYRSPIARTAAEFLYQHEGMEVVIYFQHRHDSTTHRVDAVFTRERANAMAKAVRWDPIRRNLIGVFSTMSENELWIGLDRCWRVELYQDRSQYVVTGYTCGSASSHNDVTAEPTPSLSETLSAAQIDRMTPHQRRERAAAISNLFA